jgi:NADPH2:quinone reductase
MKAVRIHTYGGPNVLVYEEVTTPQPAAGQVLVHVRAASVNPIDVAVRENRFPTPKQPPKIIGSDGAGVVEAVGPGVTAVHPGDEVVFSGLGVGSEGSYAEYAVLAEVQAVPKPAGLSFVEAAAMGLVFPTAYYGLTRRAALRPGETVLVQGAAGGVGSAAVQLAVALGGRVLGVVSSEEAAARVRELGAAATIDRSTTDVAEAARRLTESRGVDVIVEVAGSDNLAADVQAVAKGGRIVVIGAGSAPQAPLPLGAAIAIDASILFMSVNNAGRAGVAEMMREIGGLVEAGKVQPVVGAVLRLEEARRAHELLAGRHFGKIVLEP